MKRVVDHFLDQWKHDSLRKLLEVKSGTGRHLKSLQNFLESHTKSPYAVRFSTHNYSSYQNIHSYPLYAVAQFMMRKNREIEQAIKKLL